MDVFLILQMFSAINSQDYEYKCQIEWKSLNCDTNFQYFNITIEMRFLSCNLSEEERNFERLIIQGTNIEEIPENVFQDISFKYVDIYNTKNLKRIHTNAFNNNNTVFNLRERFKISSPNQLRNDPPDYDFWKALSSLTYVSSIDISLGDGSHEIPDYAFEPMNGEQNDLSRIVFESNNYEISRIGNYAFYRLPNLSALYFFHIPIRTISAQAFHLNKNSTQKLSISFHNCILSQTSLEEGIFSDANRTLSIDFCKN